MVSNIAPSPRGNSQAALPGAAPAWHGVKDEGREPRRRWQDKRHIPERLSIPGSVAHSVGASSGGQVLALRLDPWRAVGLREGAAA